MELLLSLIFSWIFTSFVPCPLRKCLTFSFKKCPLNPSKKLVCYINRPLFLSRIQLVSLIKVSLIKNTACTCCLCNKRRSRFSPLTIIALIREHVEYTYSTPRHFSPVGSGGGGGSSFMYYGHKKTVLKSQAFFSYFGNKIVVYVEMWQKKKPQHS